MLIDKNGILRMEELEDFDDDHITDIIQLYEG